MIKLSRAVSKRLGQDLNPAWILLINLQGALRKAQLAALKCSKGFFEGDKQELFPHLPDVDTRIQDALTMVEDAMASWTD